MANTKCLGGVFYVSVNGQSLSVSADTMNVPLNDITKTSLTSTTGTVGYTALRRTPYIECVAYREENFPIELLKDNDDLSVSCAFSDGTTYSLSNAWLVGDIDYDASKGTVNLRFEGKQGGFI